MRYRERSFFLIKGDVACEKIVGDRQSFLLCSDKGYLLKEVTPSSTFLVRAGNSVSAVKALLDIVDVSKESFHKHLVLSTPSKMHGHSAEDLKIRFRMGTAELEDAVQRAFLISVNGQVYRMEYRFLLNVVSYVRSLKLTKSDVRSELAIYSDVVQQWATSKVEGTVQELCILFMLSCWETGNFEGWEQRLSDTLLEEVTAQSVQNMVQSSDILQDAKSAIMDKISRGAK